MFEPTGARGINGPETGSLLFGRLFFPKAIKKLMTAQRMEYLMLLDDQTIPFLNIVGHRTFGKTVLGVIFGSRQMAMRFSRFMLYTSSEQNIASKRTEAIRAALISKEFQVIFGNMKPQRNRNASASFSEETFFLVDSKTQVPFACVSPRGSNQAVNGSIAPLGREFARVDLIFNDDGQSRRHIENGDVREAYEQWIEAELLQTVETDEQPSFVGGKLRWTNLPPTQKAPWRALFGDSYKHKLGFSIKALKNRSWESRVWPLCERQSDGTYKSVHATMTDEEVMVLYERFKSKPDYFAREFCCKPNAPDNQCYTSDMFKYASDEDLRRRRGLVKFGIMDPARAGHERANPTSILAVAVDMEKGQIFLRRNLVKNMESDEYYQALFAMARETGTVKWYIEDDGLAGVVRNAIQQAASLSGLLGEIDFDWLQSRRNPGVDYGTGNNAIKRARAAAMHPYYKAGVVFHDPSMEDGALETALLEYPDCTDWDATDTLGYIPEVLEREEIYLEGGAPEIAPVDDSQSMEYEAACKYFRSRAWCN